MFALSSQCRVRLPALSTAPIFRWINVDKSVDKLWVFIAVAGHPAITWNVGVCRQPAGIAVDGAIQLGRISMRSCKGGMMAGMSSLVRIVNAGVPGSQDRVDVVLRDGVVASVGPAGTVSASDSTMQTKAHTTSLEYATNAIASGSVSIPTSAAAPADEPPSTPTACGLFPACGTATRTSRNG